MYKFRINILIIFGNFFIYTISTPYADTSIRPFVHCAFLFVMATPVWKTFTAAVGQCIGGGIHRAWSLAQVEYHNVTLNSSTPVVLSKSSIIFGPILIFFDPKN